MGHQGRHLTMIYSFHITLRCNSRQLWIAKRFKRDVLLEVLAKAKQKFALKADDVGLIANHLPLLIRPEHVAQLPRLMKLGWLALSNGIQSHNGSLRTLPRNQVLRQSHCT